MFHMLLYKQAKELYPDKTLYELLKDKIITTCEDCNWCEIHFGAHSGYIRCSYSGHWIYEEYLDLCNHFRFK